MAASSMEHTFMMVLDHVGDQEAMVYAQLGQQPLARTTETSLEPRLGTLSCLSARPPDLAFWTGTRPQVVSMFLSIVPFLYSKRTAAARSLVSRSKSERFVAVSSQVNHSWNYPRALTRCMQRVLPRCSPPLARLKKRYRCAHLSTKSVCYRLCVL